MVRYIASVSRGCRDIQGLGFGELLLSSKVQIDVSPKQFEQGSVAY